MRRLLRRALLLAFVLSSPLAHAEVAGCTGDSRIAGCHALVRTAHGTLTDVALSYVIAPGLAYVEPRIERIGHDVVRVYFISSDYVLRTPSEMRTLPLGRFAAGTYRIEIYEGNDGLPPPPLQPPPPRQVALLGLAIGGPTEVPAGGVAMLVVMAAAMVAAARQRQG